MEVVVKYKVEKSFKDKNTKEDITEDTVLDISVERMKELNVAKIGRVVDIIVSEIETEKNVNEITNNQANKIECTKEELEKMTVNDLKELAEKKNIELTQEKRKDIIEEILQKIQ